MCSFDTLAFSFESATKKMGNPTLNSEKNTISQNYGELYSGINFAANTVKITINAGLFVPFWQGSSF